MINHKSFYYSIHKNLKKKNLFYKYFSREHSYQDLGFYVGKVLNFLIKKKIKNQVILTFSNKSFEMYSSIFPILISGNTWVPLSINLPIEKIKNVIDQAKPNLCLYDHYDEKILKILKKKIPCFNFKDINKIKKIKKISFKKMIEDLNLNSSAFIYFTSASTGKPKGIKVSHKNIISDVFAQKKHLYNKSEKNLVFADYYDTAFSIFFDIFFPAIYFGSTISPSLSKSDNYFLKDHYKKNKINTLIAVPSTFNRIKEFIVKDKEKLSGKNLIFVGEPFYLNLLKFVFKETKFETVYNIYGGTEMGNIVFYHKCKKSDLTEFKKFNLVPIGKPFDSVKPYIKNNQLIVSGPMISNGYTDQKLNQNKFIFKKNNTFFTGDKVRKIKKVYICNGRLDNMVKINGHRIEITDVEANFRKLDYLNDVVIFEKKTNNYKNYLVAAISTNLKKNELQIRKDLLDYLPSYMIPRKINIFNSLPKNSNGKLDRAKIKKSN